MEFRKANEAKIVKVLAVGLLAMCLAYIAGKEIAKFAKKKESKQTTIEFKI